MNENLRGIIGLLRSRKAWAAFIATAVASLSIIFADPDMSREEKREAWSSFIYTVGAVWGAVIVLGGVEDSVAKHAEGKRAEPPTPPATSLTLMTGDAPTNVQNAPAAATPPRAPVPTVRAVVDTRRPPAATAQPVTGTLKPFTPTRRALGSHA